MLAGPEPERSPGIHSRRAVGAPAAVAHCGCGAYGGRRRTWMDPSKDGTGPRQALRVPILCSTPLRMGRRGVHNHCQRRWAPRSRGPKGGGGRGPQGPGDQNYQAEEAVGRLTGAVDSTGTNASMQDACRSSWAEAERCRATDPRPTWRDGRSNTGESLFCFCPMPGARPDR